MLIQSSSIVLILPKLGTSNWLRRLRDLLLSYESRLLYSRLRTACITWNLRRCSLVLVKSLLGLFWCVWVIHIATFLSRVKHVLCIVLLGLHLRLLPRPVYHRVQSSCIRLGKVFIERHRFVVVLGQAFAASWTLARFLTEFALFEWWGQCCTVLTESTVAVQAHLASWIVIKQAPTRLWR